MKQFAAVVTGLALVMAIWGCQHTPPPQVYVPSEDEPVVMTPVPEESPISQDRPQDPIWAAEQKASPMGRKVLETGRIMTLENQEIIRGGCWHYANAVYNRAGFPSNKRKTIFKSKKNGPYAPPELIQSGDWVYHVNHSYGGIEHSAIFVDWVDFDQREALMLSYAGERRNEPARYKWYDLSHVYCIIRPAP